MRTVLSIRDITTLEHLQDAINRVALEARRTLKETSGWDMALSEVYVDPLAVTLFERDLTDGSHVYDVSVTVMCK